MQHIISPDPSPEGINRKGRTAVVEVLSATLPWLPSEHVGLIADWAYVPEKDLLIYRFDTAYTPISAKVT